MNQKGMKQSRTLDGLVLLQFSTNSGSVLLLITPRVKLWIERLFYPSHGPYGLQKMQIRLPFLPGPCEPQKSNCCCFHNF